MVTAAKEIKAAAAISCLMALALFHYVGNNTQDLS